MGETTTDTSDSESSALKKSRTPSARPSSSPSSALSQSDEATGVPSSESHTPCHARSTPSADPSICDSSQHHAVPVSSLHQSQRRSWLTLVTLMFTLLPRVALPPSETSLKPPSRLSLRPQA